MKIEIDQSGKVEQTARPTVVAFSNDTSGALYIPAREKRQVLAYLRYKGKHTYFPVLVFAAMILILIEKYQLKKSHITIDIEYRGKETQISQFLIGHGLEKEYLHFGSIGKQSPAHHIALTKYREKKGDVITAEQITEILFEGKKKDQT